MVSPLVRRQISISVSSLSSSSTLRSSSRSSEPTSPSTSTSIKTSVSSSTDSSDTSGPTPELPSSLSRSTSSSKTTPSPTHSPSVVTFATPTPDGRFTDVATASTTDASSSGAPQVHGNSFLKNKPLSGFVLGLAGLVVLIVVVIAVTFTVRRRKRKRLLTDASRDLEDRTSSVEEKSPHPGHDNSDHGHGESTTDVEPASDFHLEKSPQPGGGEHPCVAL